MSLATAYIAATIASANNLANSLTSVASSSAITPSVSGNVVDHYVVVGVTVGAIGASPTSTMVVNVFAAASADGTNFSGGSATNEVITGSDAAVTLAATGNDLVFLGSIPCHTQSIKHTSKPLSVAAAFGGVLPVKYVVIVQNQSSLALAASGNTIVVAEKSYT